MKYVSSLQEDTFVILYNCVFSERLVLQLLDNGNDNKTRKWNQLLYSRCVVLPIAWVAAELLTESLWEGLCPIYKLGNQFFL